MEQKIKNLIKNFSLSMYRKNFVGIFHGAISVRGGNSTFIINKRGTIFDSIKDDDLIRLNYKKDYRWHDASIDAGIHLKIYQNILEAKYVCYAMPEFSTAYSMKRKLIIPEDYFTFQQIGEIRVYDPKDFKTWYDRADKEISEYFMNNRCNIMLIKGYGIYTYGRDLRDIIKQIALIENCCKLLYRKDL
jgi:L-fuculose-phosphate aldolase